VSQESASDRIELLNQIWVTRAWRRYQRSVKRRLATGVAGRAAIR
jgi:hypothetical protein